MANLYSNENFPFPVVEKLRQLGHFDPDFEGLAYRIHKAISEQPILSGQLIRINRPSNNLTRR